MFKVNNRSTTHHSGVFIVNLYLALLFLLTLNMQIPDRILYYLDLNLSIPFGVESRSPPTFKTELSVIIVNNSSQLLPFFVTNSSILDVTQSLN